MRHHAHAGYAITGANVGRLEGCWRVGVEHSFCRINTTPVATPGTLGLPVFTVCKIVSWLRHFRVVRNTNADVLRKRSFSREQVENNITGMHPGPCFRRCGRALRRTTIPRVLLVETRNRVSTHAVHHIQQTGAMPCRTDVRRIPSPQASPVGNILCVFCCIRSYLSTI